MVVKIVEKTVVIVIIIMTMINIDDIYDNDCNDNHVDDGNRSGGDDNDNMQ